jgi:putative intracellular protease/amidase
MADKEPAGRSNSLNEVVSEAVQACVEYAAVGDALGYPGVRGRERLLDAVQELARWLRGSSKISVL